MVIAIEKLAMSFNDALPKPGNTLSPHSDTFDQKEQFKKLALALLLFLLLGGVCSYLFKSEIMYIGESLYEKFGIASLVIGTVITDTSPLPLTSEPIALIGLGAEEKLINIILIMSITSHICGPIGYFCGHLLGKIPNIKTKFRQTLPALYNWIEKHGVKGVGLAALLPIPYALSTWTAGLIGVSFWGVVLASSLRWIKMILTISLLAGGWFMGG